MPARNEEGARSYARSAHIVCVSLSQDGVIFFKRRDHVGQGAWARDPAPPEGAGGGSRRGAKILGPTKCSISAVVVPRARAWTRRVDSRSQNLKQTGIKKVGSTFLFLKSAILGFFVSVLGQVLGQLVF